MTLIAKRKSTFSVQKLLQAEIYHPCEHYFSHWVALRFSIPDKKYWSEKRSDLRKQVLFCASDGMNHVFMNSNSIYDFLQTSAKSKLILQNAAQDYWKLYEYCEYVDVQVSLDCLQQRLCPGRLHDLQMLDVLMRQAEDHPSRKLFPRPHNQIYQELAISHRREEPTEIHVPKGLLKRMNTEITHREASRLITETAKLARYFTTLSLQAAKRMRSHGWQSPPGKPRLIDPDALAQYGRLAESLQTAAAVALHKVSSYGVCVNQAKLKEQEREARGAIDHTAHQLRDNHPGLLKTDSEGRLKRTPIGQIPSFSKYRLEELLEEVYDTLAEEHDIHWDELCTNKGNLSSSRQSWEPWIEYHPFLKLWFEFREQVSHLESVERLNKRKLHPTYTVSSKTGRTSCSKPNFQNIPATGNLREVVVPSPGHLFLNVDYKYIEMVALAALCEQWYGGSRLADTIRAGIDPHCQTAAVLQNLTLEEFQSLKLTKPHEYHSWRRLAKIINFGIPVGMSAATITDTVRQQTHIRLNEYQAKDFIIRLRKWFYPELQKYLNQEQTYDGFAVTPTGRIRGGVSYTEQRNTPFQALAADGAKVALIDLIRAGYRVVGFVHDEFLIELPDEGGFVSKHNLKHPLHLIRRGMESVLSGLPVRYEYSVATCWSPRAQLLDRGDFVRAWSPPG